MSECVCVGGWDLEEGQQTRYEDTCMCLMRKAVEGALWQK